MFSEDHAAGLGEGPCFRPHEGTDGRNPREHTTVNRIPRRGTGLRRALTAGLALGITLGVAATAQATFPGANGKIAYTLFDAANQRPNVFVINADGTGATNLTGGASAGGTNPEWSPDGSRIIFATSTRGDSEVHAMDPDGSNRVMLYQGGRSPVFAPDGVRIAYIDGANAIRIAKADGSGVIPFTSPAGILFTGLDWSPDGTTLAARGESAAAGVRIYLVNVGTGVATPLVGGDGANYDDPEWSSDGGKVFYHRDNTNLLPVLISNDVWSINADGTGNTKLTTASNTNRYPAPSPDGTKVAFLGSFNLRQMNPDGTGDTSVAGFAASALDWQPVTAVASKPIVVKNVVDPQIRAVTGFEVLKSASTKAGWDAKDGSLRVDYRVEVRRTLARRGASFGQVQVTNPNGFAVSVSPSIAQPGATCDLVDDRGTPLSGPVSVAGNGGALFLFACSAPAVPSGSVTSTATVAWSVDGTVQSPVSDARALSWDGVQEVTEGLTSVKVTDTMSGKATKVLAESLTEARIFRYRTFIRPGQKCRTYKNTARLLEGSVLVPFGAGLTPLPEPKVVDEDFTTVRVCPQPKDDASPKDPPVVTIDNGDGAKPVDPKPTDNPRGEVITDPRGGGAKLRVTKTASVKRAAKGSVVIWSITVRNTGTSDLDEVVVRDLLPKGLVAVTDAKAPLQKARRGKRVVTFSAGDLLRGQQVTIRVATRATRTGRICNIARAEAGNARSHRAISCIRIGTPVITG